MLPGWFCIVSEGVIVVVIIAGVDSARGRVNIKFAPSLSSRFIGLSLPMSVNHNVLRPRPRHDSGSPANIQSILPDSPTTALEPKLPRYALVWFPFVLKPIEPLVIKLEIDRYVKLVHWRYGVCEVFSMVAITNCFGRIISNTTPTTPALSQKETYLYMGCGSAGE
ncbi:hypothetical protein IW262DRAFT_1296031 [Armillaria fumosa]|nr:hypothetical protein IW262DRAFT_1296031 [Armillaria fumosa]